MGFTQGREFGVRERMEFAAEVVISLGVADEVDSRLGWHVGVSSK